MLEGQNTLILKSCGTHNLRTTAAEMPSLELPCPFFAPREQICGVKEGQGQVNAARRQLCGSDDHDRCPTYLAYLLRRSRPLRCDCDWLDAV